MSGVHIKLWDTGYTSPCRQPRVSQVEWSPPSEQCLIATSSREHIPHHRFMVLRCSKLNLNWDILSFHAPHLLFPYSQHPREHSNRLLHIETHPRQSWGSAKMILSGVHDVLLEHAGTSSVDQKLLDAAIRINSPCRPNGCTKLQRQLFCQRRLRPQQIRTS